MWPVLPSAHSIAALRAGLGLHPPSDTFDTDALGFSIPATHPSTSLACRVDHVALSPDTVAESAGDLQAGPDQVWYFAFGSNMNPKVCLFAGMFVCYKRGAPHIQ